MTLSFVRRLARASFLASLIACAWPVAAQAQRDTCATMSAQFSADPNKTLGQVEFEARNSNRSRLLATLGITINATSQVTTTAVGDSVHKVMQQAVTQQTTGTITRDTVLGWTTTDGKLWTMRYFGCAEIVVGHSDPKFWVKAHLNKNPPTYAWTQPREGRDTIVATISVSLASYITVLSRGEDDSLIVTYPSASIGEPERRLLMPDDSMAVPPAGVKIRVIMDANAQASRPTMIIIATKRDIPIRPTRPPSNPNAFWKMSWQEYIQWYNRIPIDQKTMVELPYQIQNVTRR